AHHQRRTTHRVSELGCDRGGRVSAVLDGVLVRNRARYLPRGRNAGSLQCRSEQRRESKFAVESGSGAVCVPDAAQPRPELDGVIAVDDGSVVLQLVMVLMVKLVALVVAPPAERSQNVKRGLAVQGKLIIQLAQVLEARFIYYLCTKDLRIANLQSVLSGIGIVTLRSQGELTDALVIFNIAVE